MHCKTYKFALTATDREILYNHSSTTDCTARSYNTSLIRWMPTMGKVTIQHWPIKRSFIKPDTAWRPILTLVFVPNTNLLHWIGYYAHINPVRNTNLIPVPCRLLIWVMPHRRFSACVSIPMIVRWQPTVIMPLMNSPAHTLRTKTAPSS